MTKLYCSGTLGLIFGYLSGYNLYFSSAIVKVSILIFLTSLLFLQKAKHDIWLKYVLHVTLAFTVLFIYGNIAGHNLSIAEVDKGQNINVDAVVREVTIKDSAKILEVDFIKKDTQMNYDSAAVYTYGQDSFYPDEVIKISGYVSESFIILPKDKETDFKSFDLGLYFQTKNIDGVMMNPKISTSNFSETNKNHSLNYYAYKFRESFRSNLNVSMPSEEAGIVMAMLWGDETGISKNTNEIYKKGGLSHVLVLSGYNLSILVFLSVVVFKKFSLNKKLFSSFFLVSIFLLFAKTGTSVWRAAFMSFYFMLSTLFMRDINIKFLVWLCAFMFSLLSIRTALFDISFHLSIMATISIVYLQPALKDIFKIIKNNTMKDVLSVTISASIGVAPYLMYQFAYFNILGIFISAIVSLFVPLIMLFGFLSGSIAYVSVLFGKILAYPTFLFTNIMSDMATISANSGSLISHPIKFYTMCLLYTIIFISYYLLNFSSSYKRSINQ